MVPSVPRLTIPHNWVACGSPSAAEAVSPLRTKIQWGQGFPWSEAKDAEIGLKEVGTRKPLVRGVKTERVPTVPTSAKLIACVRVCARVYTFFSNRWGQWGHDRVKVYLIRGFAVPTCQKSKWGHGGDSGDTVRDPRRRPCSPSQPLAAPPAACGRRPCGSLSPCGRGPLHARLRQCCGRSCGPLPDQLRTRSGGALRARGAVLVIARHSRAPGRPSRVGPRRPARRAPLLPSSSPAVRSRKELETENLHE